MKTQQMVHPRNTACIICNAVINYCLHISYNDADTRRHGARTMGKFARTASSIPRFGLGKSKIVCDTGGDQRRAIIIRWTGTVRCVNEAIVDVACLHCEISQLREVDRIDIPRYAGRQRDNDSCRTARARARAIGRQIDKSTLSLASGMSKLKLEWPRGM